MGFFGIGTGELLLILIVALIIWGPGRLPEIARTLGKTVRALRKASSDFTSTITKEIDNTTELPSKTDENPGSKAAIPSLNTGDDTDSKKPAERQQQ